MRILRLLSGAGLVLALTAARPVAAERAPKKAEPPVFGSDLSLVALPVFVVDKQGGAMRGLSAADFELLDDGKPVRIVSFQYVDTTSSESQEEIREAPAARRHFLLLFDLTFTDPGGLHRARQAARELVRTRLAETDLVSVATFDFNRGVRVVANFTEDRALLLHAIETLGVTSQASISDPLALAASVNATEVVDSVSRRTGDDIAIQTEVFLAAVARRLRVAEDQTYLAQVGYLVDSFSELGRSLRGVEGRKQILYFSAGFDSQVLVGETSGSEMSDTAEAVTQGRIFDVDSQARFGDTRLRSVLSAMARALSSSDCVVHSVDVTGLGSDTSLQQTSGTTDSLKHTRGYESLNFMASETGGRFFKAANDLGVALDEILAMTSRYYILGYQPEDLAGPGRFHKLKVKVLRKGSRVSHRAGYYERGPLRADSVLQRKFEAAQLVMTGVGQSNLRFSAVCLPFPSPGDRQTVGVVVQVPKSEVRWDAPVSIELYGYAVAPDGTVQDHVAQFARVDPAAADPGNVAQGLSFVGMLQVPPGKYTLRLMVVEAESGSSGVQFIDVTVPPHDPRSGFLLPPVFVDEPEQWLTLTMSSEPGRPRSPFVVDGKTLLPRTSFQVRPGTLEKLVLIAFEPERSGDPAAGINIQGSVTDASGNPVPAGRLRIDRIYREHDGRRTYVLGYTPQALAAGDYTLRIGINEAGSRLESYSLLRVAPGASAPGLP